MRSCRPIIFFPCSCRTTCLYLVLSLLTEDECNKNSCLAPSCVLAWISFGRLPIESTTELYDIIRNILTWWSYRSLSPDVFCDIQLQANTTSWSFIVLSRTVLRILYLKSPWGWPDSAFMPPFAISHGRCRQTNQAHQPNHKQSTNPYPYLQSLPSFQFDNGIHILPIQSPTQRPTGPRISNHPSQHPSTNSTKTSSACNHHQRFTRRSNA